MLKYQMHTLKNGLRVVLAPMPENETATVIIMTGTGSRYETKKENGLAHFLEHMFFKGTKKRKGAKSISEELETIGSVYNAFTAKDKTAYYAKVSARYLDKAFDVISDMFLNSTLPQNEITKERGAIIQEINMYEDMPMATIDNVFDALIFGEEHPLGRAIIGSKENIRSFSRKDFTEYLRRNYTPANTVICIAGAFSSAKILGKIKKEFGQKKSLVSPPLIPFTEVQNARRVAIKEKKTDQTQLMLGVPAYPYLHKDEYALEVLTTILGAGMSSRLFIEIREKRGLAYSVHASTEKFPDTGYFSVSAGIEHGKLGDVIETILAEFRKIKKISVPSHELKKAKAFMQGALTLSLETSDAIAQNAASSLISIGHVRTLEEHLKAIAAVTAADVQRVANDLLRTDRLNLAVIGPHTNKERLLSLLRV